MAGGCIFAQMGEFAVAGCEGTSPVLVLTPGVEYTFVQTDTTSWFHPLGFAYYPDGAHVGAPELRRRLRAARRVRRRLGAARTSGTDRRVADGPRQVLSS